MEIPTSTATNQLPSSSEGSTAITNASSELGRDEFLQLLMTQLQNQDPLNPMESYEFAAQLAQFSSVEQLVNIGETLETSNESSNILSQSVNSGVAAGLIGQTIEADDNGLGWNGDDPVDFGIEFARPATTVTVTILNEQGSEVGTLELGSAGAGLQSYTWDGRDRNGVNLPEGAYSFTINAVDEAGDPIPTNAVTKGKVDRVTFGPDGIFVWSNGNSVPMSMVRSVGETP